MDLETKQFILEVPWACDPVDCGTLFETTVYAIGNISTNPDSHCLIYIQSLVYIEVRDAFR